MARAVALTRDAAARWLTTDTINAIGRSVAVSVTRHRRVTGRQPTWAEALAGVDPALLVPMTAAPKDWPLPDFDMASGAAVPVDGSAQTQSVGHLHAHRCPCGSELEDGPG